MKQPLLIITGPTATGKTALAVRLAQQLHTEVISADSMQIYRGMDIGTAKPTMEERGGIVHHMLDVCAPDEAFSVARYVEQASPLVESLLAQGKTPIIAGGTGQYIDALVRGNDFPPFTGAVRAQLQARLEEQGIAPLYAELGRVDPERAALLAENDHKRILRALEVYYETGETISAHDRRSAAQPPRYESRCFVLQYAERADLYRRIDARVEEMRAQGLRAEVEGLLSLGIPADCTAMQAIGYKELLPVLTHGADEDEAFALIAQRSRNYAKRQLTWHRRNAAAIPLVWQGKPDLDAAIEQITHTVN